MEWIKASERLPKSGRYLVYLECDTKMHQAIAWDWAYPCEEINIMYYSTFTNGWYFATQHSLNGDQVIVSWWAQMPKKPKSIRAVRNVFE